MSPWSLMFKLCAWNSQAARDRLDECGCRWFDSGASGGSARCFRGCHRNFSSASVVSLGRSSSTQCPVSFSTTTVTSEATNFVC